MNVEKLVDCELAEETEALDKNPIQYHFVHKCHMTRPGIERWPSLWKSATNPSELWNSLCN
jgi:hypothetical protein